MARKREYQKVIKQLNTIVPKEIKFLINEIDYKALKDAKYGSCEYIGPEVHCYRNNDESIDWGLKYKHEFAEMGLHVQEYSSGNVRFRILKRSTEETPSPVSLAVNSYFDAYEEAFEISKKIVAYDQLLYSIKRLYAFVIGSRVCLVPFVNNESFVKTNLFIEDNFTFDKLHLYIEEIKDIRNFINEQWPNNSSKLDTDLDKFNETFDAFINKRDLINSIIYYGHHECQTFL